jgi:DNA-binding NarL/FixJ family response regulator
MSTFRVLVVDDHELIRKVVRLILQQRDDLQIVGEASDGLEAVQKAKVLRPDLILLDIDLPRLNGIQAARRLRDLVPRAKVLFLSVESSSDVVREAFNVGGAGYIYKLHVGSELLPAIETVLRGKQFIGSHLEDEFSESTARPTPPHRHEMLIYSDDAVLVESFTRFIATTLMANNAAIVLATKSHREILAQRLRERGFDIDGAIQQGTFISLDAAEMLSTIMVNSVPDRVLFFEGLRGLIESTAKAAKTEHPRVAIFGECVGLLYAEGNLNAAISLEKAGNNLAKTHNIDILCAYPWFQGKEGDSAFNGICAEHSAISFR